MSYTLNMANETNGPGMDPKITAELNSEGWVDCERDPVWGSIKDLDINDTGLKMRITYDDADGERIAEGRLVQHFQASTTLQTDRGDLVTANNNDHNIKAAMTYPDSRLSGFDVIHSGDILSRLESGVDIEQALCSVSGVGDGERKQHLIRGKPELLRLGNDYSVLQIRDERGVEHWIDPNISSPLVLVPSNSQEGEVFQSTKERVLIYDPEKQDRIDLARKLIASGDILGQAGYYEYFQRDPSLPRQLFTQWYDRRFPVEDVVNEVTDTLGEAYVSLLANPGVMQHHQEFLQFATQMRDENGELPPITNLLTQFSEHLGTATVYRGMMLTPDEVGQLAEAGAVAPGLRDVEAAAWTLEALLCPYRQFMRRAVQSQSLHDEIVGRLTDLGENQDSMLLSVSAYPEVAQSVGFHDSRQTRDASRNMHVITAELPRLSVITMEGPFNSDYKPGTLLRMGEKVFDEENDLAVEMFVPFSLPQQSIGGVELITSTPPKWERTPK